MSGLFLEIERAYMHGYLTALMDVSRNLQHADLVIHDEVIDILLRDAIRDMTQDAYTLGKGPESEASE